MGKNNFDFDSNEPVPAEKPFRDYSELLDEFILNLYATAVCLAGIRLILFVADGGANAIIFWAASKLFGPLFWPLASWH